MLWVGGKMSRGRPGKRKAIIRLFGGSETIGLTRGEVASRLGITYWSARYWLEKLASDGQIRKAITYSVRNKVRGIVYYLVVAKVFYRTQYALMFYTEVPRDKTPDPIAEFRVTAVSSRRDAYSLEEFERACIYIGVILAPQTYWIKQKIEITANEKDEMIDVDELTYSVPVYGKLDYAERYAVFFRSRRGTESWRQTHIGWWLVGSEPRPAPREGDFEYSELFIKNLEENKIALGTLNKRFNNTLGEMESVTT
jgi:hypothetical protein